MNGKCVFECITLIIRDCLMVICDLKEAIFVALKAHNDRIIQIQFLIMQQAKKV